MATANSSIIVLDDDDEDEAAAQPGPSHPPPSPASTRADAPGSSQPPGAEGSPSSGGKKCYKLENKQLFEEFLELCKTRTADHPEVVPFLSDRQQRAHPLFLASAEFCNVLTRVLSRARNRPAKLYVYINELCTVLKANSAKKKINLASVATAAGEPSGSHSLPHSSLDAGPSGRTTGSEVPRTRGSRRQIQRLEQLLALYVAEIRRLQEKELDLSELEDPDSTYIQEDRLKQKLIRLFGRLCELKDCSSLTGRVIEQRIPYRGTRYPEINRRIERLINRPGLDTFPDYGDVLRAVEKAATRHSLGLTRQQLQLMAQDAFRDVGVRLQERRHLDLIYNFGCHLTDEYRPGFDPALSDSGLARRLRENRSLAMSRLDEVISKYAMMQDQSEEGERQRRRARLPQAASSHSADPSGASLESGEGPSGMAAQECLTTSTAETDDEEDEESEEEEEDEDDEDEDEDMEQIQEGQGDTEEEEEEEEAGQDGDKSPMSPPQSLPKVKLESSTGISESSGEPKDKELRVSPSSLSGKAPALFSQDAESNGGHLEELPPKEESPMSQIFELEIEALPLDATPSPEEREISSSRKQPEGPLTTVLENGAALITSTSFNGGVSHTWRDSSPPRKKSRKEKQGETRPLENSYMDTQSPVHKKNGKMSVPPNPPSPLASLAPVADSSTRADSPSHGLVTSSLCSPAAAGVPRTSTSQPSRPSTCKMSVATQCDPEEIIVLSDSD